MLIKDLIRQYKYYLCGVGVGLLVLLAAAILLFNQPAKKEAENLFQEDVTSSVALTDTQETSQQDVELFVDVKGAVKKPGMYKARSQMRIWDVIGLAGGVKEEADTKEVNFSERITDQMVIYIPVIGEILPDTSIDDKSETNKFEATTSTSNKIDLNKASETELQTLTGIGQKKALEIIRYREENGGFKTIDDLKNISGIGEKTIEKLKEQITVS